MYFRELERIEKISARLALPFGVLLAVAALLSFLLNSANKPTEAPWHGLFWTFFALSCISLAVGAWFFRMAWFGHLDKLMPTAAAIEDYYETLTKTYEEFEDAADLTDKAFASFLFDYYQWFASENAINNDRRSYNIYRALVTFTLAVFFSLISAVPFYVGTLTVEDSQHDQENSAAAATATPGS